MLRLDAITLKVMGVGLSTLALSAATQAEIIDVKWNAEGKFDRTQSIAPGKFVEICEHLPKDSVVAWRFKASAPLNFNLHFHQGEAVAFPEKHDGVSELQGTFVAQSKEDYCWMWTNKRDMATNVQVLLAKSTAKR